MDSVLEEKRLPSEKIQKVTVLNLGTNLSSRISAAVAYEHMPFYVVMRAYMNKFHSNAFLQFIIIDDMPFFIMFSRYILLFNSVRLD